MGQFSAPNIDPDKDFPYFEFAGDEQNDWSPNDEIDLDGEPDDWTPFNYTPELYTDEESPF